ncbi:MAG: hypothetical protein ACYC5H_01160 [Methylovirgula sp.]
MAQQILKCFRSVPISRIVYPISSVARRAFSAWGGRRLEHVPEKLNDFSDKNMLQPIDFERFLLDRMIPSGRKTL